MSATEVPPNFITMRAMSLYQSSAGPAEGCDPASRNRPLIHAGPLGKRAFGKGMQREKNGTSSCGVS